MYALLFTQRRPTITVNQ